MFGRYTSVLFWGSILSFNAAAQVVGGCPVFPANNIWNARVDGLPLHARSAAWVTSIGPTAVLHPDFGMPVNLVTGSQPKVPIVINEGADESDPGPYPFPPNAVVEAGSDAHVLVVDTTNCLLYETFFSVKNADNSWTVYSGAIFDLRKNLLRPQTWTSADAAGLPIMPGLARYEEILEGEIKHALRFTAPRTTREYLWPARHFASQVVDPTLPSMGARFRLKANYDISSFSPTSQIILTALKRYGMMVADNGSSWFVQGTDDPRWPNIVDEWRRIPGSAFEAVDTSGLIESVDSAAVRGAVTTAPSLVSAAVTLATVTGGQASTLRVTLSAAAPAGGVQITLSSANAILAPVPPSVLIPEGSSSADVPVNTTTVPVSTPVILTASLAGLSRQATLTVNPAAASLQSAAFLASTVIGGQGATLRISLSSPAASATVVTLGSGNTNVATIAGSVQIPSGGSSVDVPVATAAVSSPTQVVFTAAAGGLTRQATLTVNPAIAATLTATALALNPLTGGVNTTLLVTLSQAATGAGVAVSLASGNPAVASVPPSATVPAGSSVVQVPVTTFSVSSTVQVVLTATVAGSSRPVTLTVNPPALSALVVNPASVSGGTGANCTLTLSGRAPASGLRIAIGSSNQSVVSTPPSVDIPGGQSSVIFPVATQTVTKTTTVQIRASWLGAQVAANLTVNPSATPTLSGIVAALIQNGSRLRVTASLTAAARGNTRVNLTGSNNSVVNLSGRQILITAGATSASADFAVVPAAVDVTLLVTGSLGSVVKSTSILIPKTVVTLSEIRHWRADQPRSLPPPE